MLRGPFDCHIAVWRLCRMCEDMNVHEVIPARSAVLNPRFLSFAIASDPKFAFNFEYTAKCANGTDYNYTLSG